MRSRTKARSLALQFLYQNDIVKEEFSIELLQEFFDYEEVEGEVAVFAKELLVGVFKTLDQLNEIIAGCLDNWDLNRIAIVDKNILRIATYELLHSVEVPAKVAVNEAIELGKIFGSKNSGGFINGVLDKIMKTKILL